MKKKQKPPMSLWGIGPIYAIFNIIVMGGALVLSFIYSEKFRFTHFPVLFYILGGIFIFFGFSFWRSGAKQIDDCIFKGVLATQGAYGMSRNPIYSGALFFILGITLAVRSWLLLALFPLSYLVLKLLLLKEEKLLINAFGQEYFDYKKRVNDVFPKPSSIYKAFFYPVETQKVTDSLYAVKSKDANLFIYKTENNCIAFDTGYGEDKILKEIEKLGIKAKDITTIFLTHSDHDHSAGIKLLPEAKLYFGRDEEPLVKRDVNRFGFIYKNPEIKREYSLLDDNQTVIIDNTEIKTIYTPGHTIGHVIYKINDEIIISGDSVIWQNGFVKPFYRLFNMDNKKTKESSKIVAEFEGKYIICTAHTGIVYKD